MGCVLCSTGFKAYTYTGREMEEDSQIGSQWSDIIKRKEVVVTSCGHMFHGRCIDKLMESKSEKDLCPLCDEKIYFKTKIKNNFLMGSERIINSNNDSDRNKSIGQTLDSSACAPILLNDGTSGYIKFAITETNNKCLENHSKISIKTIKNNNSNSSEEHIRSLQNENLELREKIKEMSVEHSKELINKDTALDEAILYIIQMEKEVEDKRMSLAKLENENLILSQKVDQNVKTQADFNNLEKQAIQDRYKIWNINIVNLDLKKEIRNIKLENQNLKQSINNNLNIQKEMEKIVKEKQSLNQHIENITLNFKNKIKSLMKENQSLKQSIDNGNLELESKFESVVKGNQNLRQNLGNIKISKKNQPSLCFSLRMKVKVEKHQDIQVAKLYNPMLKKRVKKQKKKQALDNKVKVKKPRGVTNWKYKIKSRKSSVVRTSIKSKRTDWSKVTNLNANPLKRMRSCETVNKQVKNYKIDDVNELQLQETRLSLPLIEYKLSKPLQFLLKVKKATFFDILKLTQLNIKEIQELQSTFSFNLDYFHKDSLPLLLDLFSTPASQHPNLLHTFYLSAI